MTSTTPQQNQPVAGYAPATSRRPSLTKRQKRGTVWGGIVGFNLLTFGFWLVMLPVVAAISWSLFRFIIATVSKSLNGSGMGPSAGDFGFDMSPWVLPGIGVAILGLAFMAVAIILSLVILKVHGVNRPTGVTWAGAGIAVVSYWILTWIPVVIVRLSYDAMVDGGVGWGAIIGIAGALLLLLLLVVNSVIGWLAWWWMAYAMRASASPAGATTTQE